jgi:hypothetical protein
MAKDHTACFLHQGKLSADGAEKLLSPGNSGPKDARTAEPYGHIQLTYRKKTMVLAPLGQL